MGREDGPSSAKQCFEHRFTECILGAGNGKEWLPKEGNIWFCIYRGGQWPQEGQLGSSSLLS